MQTQPPLNRKSLVGELLRRPAHPHFLADPLRPILASLLAGRALGEGILSATLGLSAAEFAQLWERYFSGPPLPLDHGAAESLPELTDLIALLLDYRGGADEGFDWMARIVAAGCAGRDHLWQDLGLANRGELSQLMQSGFPRLAEANSGDMKWKKFIYRQYCARDGIYLCPAPSCGECADYARCFAPEE